MHDIRWIRDNAEAFDAALKRRGLEPLAQSLIDQDEKRRQAITTAEQGLARRNGASKEIGEAKKAKDDARAAALMAEVAELKTRLPELEAASKAASDELDKRLAEIPNLPYPAPDVPDGKDEHGNVEHHHFGAKRTYGFKPNEHVDLGETLGLMDFEAAAKMSGARFVVLKKGLARLERALGQFMLDVHTGEHGYTEINPPLLVRDEAMFGTAQLPKFRDDQFQSIDLKLPDKEQLAQDAFAQKPIIEDIKNRRGDLLDEVTRKNIYMGDFAEKSEVIGEIFDRTLIGVVDLISKANLDRLMSSYDTQIKENRRWLIPTAEVSLTNLVRESILDEKELPLRYTALTPCFRAEAGAAGRDTRGMIRQHQFNKVELVSITTPETAKDEHERMLSCAEEILRRLGLHYRVMTLCAGDMGFASQKTWDIEVWMPGQTSSQGDAGMYREISSCSVCGEFQARRMNARSRGPDGKPRFVHTLNGSGTAVGRALIAVMETYQQQGGSIAVPDVLLPYMGGLKVIEKGT